MSKLPSPCSQCWRVQRHHQSLRTTLSSQHFQLLHVPCWNWPSLDTHSASTRFAALYPTTGALLPTLREDQACCWWDQCCGSWEPRKEQSSHGGRAVCRLTHPPWAKLGDGSTPSYLDSSAAATQQHSPSWPWQPPSLTASCSDRNPAPPDCCYCYPRASLSTPLLQLGPTALQISQLPVSSPPLKLLVCKTSKTHTIPPE